jgi:hypothetical protein
MFTGGDTSAWKNLVGQAVPSDTAVPMIFHKSIKTTTTSVQVLVSSPKRRQANQRAKILLGGDPIFNQGWYVHPNYSFTSCLSFLNKRKMFASTMCLKSCLYPRFRNDEWLLS